MNRLPSGGHALVPQVLVVLVTALGRTVGGQGARGRGGLGPRGRRARRRAQSLTSGLLERAVAAVDGGEGAVR